MQLADFDFDLPESFIAQNPASPRDSAKLMVLDRDKQTITHRHFYDLPAYLSENDVMVVNRSRVIPARICFVAGGARLEIFLLKKLKGGLFECLVKPGKKFALGATMEIDPKISATIKEVLPDGTREIEFAFSNTGEPVPESVIFELGQTPLPPYIKHSTADFNDYQTVYAKEFGSVAAPTAGLHFTDELLAKLRASGTEVVELLLHVNRGTFQTVKTEKIAEHKMHSEFFSLDEECAKSLNAARKAGKRIVAVGTTSVRVLESNFADGKFFAGSGETDIFIYPGYKWRCVDALITNFHLPKSTLLMLVSSFAGKDFAMKAYEEAKKHEYKFFSFGDGMLIL